MRIGEMQALTWADLDFENRLITVDKSFHNGRITSTKNRRSRKVDMSPHLAETLRELKSRQWKKYARTQKGVPQLVFAGQRRGVLLGRRLVGALHTILNKLDLQEIRVHDLRHSYATIRLLKGHNIGDVSYQLGHSSISITYDVYGHWLPGKFKSEVDELDTQPNATYTQPESNKAEIQ